MTTFPRTKWPRLVTPIEFPEGLEQWSPSGKGQFRAFDNAGVAWQETYSAFNVRGAVGRALLQAIEQGRREKIIWDIQHPHLRTNNGAGGGTPIVAGSGQAGDELVIEGAEVNVTGWLRRGDLFTVAPHSLVRHAAGDVDTSSDGVATIPLQPPTFVGWEPADGALINIDASTIYFKAVIVGVDIPDIEADGLITGVSVRWREQPA